MINDKKYCVMLVIQLNLYILEHEEANKFRKEKGFWFLYGKYDI